MHALGRPAEARAGRGGGEVQGALHVIGARSPEQQPRRRQRARREHLGLAVADAQGDREGLGGELFAPLQLGAVHHRQPAAQLEDPGEQALVAGGLAAAVSRKRSPPSKSIDTRTAIASARTGPRGAIATNRSASARAVALSPAAARYDTAVKARRRRAAGSVGGVTRTLCPAKSAASADAPRRAARPAAACSSAATSLSGPVARQGQVAGAGVGVVDHVGQPGVQRLALQRVERGEHRRRQQWVGEAHHEVVADGEQPLVDRLGDPAHGIGIAAGAGDRRRRRRPERGGDAQHVAQPGGRPGEAARQRSAQRRRDRRHQRVVEAVDGPRQFDRVHRVAGRQLVDPFEGRPRQRVDERSDHPTDLVDRQRPEEQLLADDRPAACARPVGATGRAARWPAPAPAHGRGAGRRSAALRPTPDRATGRRRSPPPAVSSTRAGARRRGPAARARTGRRRRPACPHSRRRRRTGRPAPRSERGSSSSVARVTSVPAPAARLRCSAHRHSDVLPMPASPRTTTTRDPRAIPLTSAASRSTSRSRPTKEGSGGATIGCTVTAATVPQPSGGPIGHFGRRTLIWSLCVTQCAISDLRPDRSYRDAS